MNSEFYDISGNGLLSEFIPWLRPFYYSSERALKNLYQMRRDIIEEKFKEHQKSYQEGILRDFTDCVLTARDEAINENKSSAKWLADDNMLVSIVNDLFAGEEDLFSKCLKCEFIIHCY